MELFSAFEHNKIPLEGGGYILSIFYDNENKTMYTRYELIAYNNVKDISFRGNQLWFKSDGYKVHILLEPSNYPQRFQEPLLREKNKSIPYKFKDLEVFTVGDQKNRVMVSINPQFNLSSFTVQKPENDDFAVFFLHSEKIFKDIREFLVKIIQTDIRAHSQDAKKVARFIIKVIQNLKFNSYG